MQEGGMRQGRTGVSGATPVDDGERRQRQRATGHAPGIVRARSTHEREQARTPHPAVGGHRRSIARPVPADRRPLARQRLAGPPGRRGARGTSTGPRASSVRLTGPGGRITVASYAWSWAFSLRSLRGPNRPPRPRRRALTPPRGRPSWPAPWPSSQPWPWSTRGCMSCSTPKRPSCRRPTKRWPSRWRRSSTAAPSTSA